MGLTDHWCGGAPEMEAACVAAQAALQHPRTQLPRLARPTKREGRSVRAAARAASPTVAQDERVAHDAGVGHGTHPPPGGAGPLSQLRGAGGLGKGFGGAVAGRGMRASRQQVWDASPALCRWLAARVATCAASAGQASGSRPPRRSSAKASSLTSMISAASEAGVPSLARSSLEPPVARK
jgi:hypothetical protein